VRFVVVGGVARRFRDIAAAISKLSARSILTLSMQSSGAGSVASPVSWPQGRWRVTKSASSASSMA
jgi:hypothetical protein